MIEETRKDVYCTSFSNGNRLASIVVITGRSYMIYKHVKYLRRTWSRALASQIARYLIISFVYLFLTMTRLPLRYLIIDTSISIWKSKTCAKSYDDDGAKTYTYKKVRIQMDTSNTFSRYELRNIQIDILHSRLASQKHRLNIYRNSSRIIYDWGSLRLSANN